MKTLITWCIKVLIYALAVYATCCLFYGHVGGGQWGLNPIEDYISRYAATMPDGKWQYIVRAMMATGAMVVALGGLVALLSRSRCNRWIIAMYALAAIALFGVAYYPIERKALPTPQLSTFDRVWNAVFQKEAPPSSVLPDRQFSSMMHQRAIEMTLFAIMIGGVLTFVALRGVLPASAWVLPLACYLGSLACFIYIILHREHSQIIGLMQRLGFVGIYGWVIALTYRLGPSKSATSSALAGTFTTSER